MCTPNLVNTLLLLIATGESYHQYIRPLLASADEFFVPHETLLLTDCPNDFGVHQVYKANAGYPETTLKRYHSFLEYGDFISQFDNCFYIDIDALFVKPVGAEIFSDGITATLHHGYLHKPISSVIERNPQSAAYLPSASSYYCGGFNGGASATYLGMADAICAGIDADARKKIVAMWHDESHLNKYLAMHPPAKVLDSSYGYPETELETPNNAKIVFLEKAWRGGR